MEKEVIISAKTVDEAIARGCEELGVTTEEITFDILEMPAKRIFGFLKPSLAKVKITLCQPEEEKVVLTPPKKQEKRESRPEKKREEKKPQPKEEIPQKPAVKREILSEDKYTESIKNAIKYLNGLFEKMGLQDLSIQACLDEEGVLLLVSGESSGTVIGRHGETMSALQYLTSLVVNRGKEEYYRVTLDVENYREKRQQALENLARRISRNVLKSGRNMTLEPMNPYERRIIHATVQKIDGVVSISTGEEPNRRVSIKPKYQKHGGPRNRSGNSRDGYGKKPFAEKSEVKEKVQPVKEQVEEKIPETVKEAPLYSKIEID